MDGGDGPAVQFRNVSQVFHVGEVALGDGDGGLFDLAGPSGDDPVAAGGQWEYADAVKEAPQGQRAADLCLMVRFIFRRHSTSPPA